MSFVSLHVHDYYSLLDSVARPEKLVDKAKALGMTALGLTNHGHLFSHVKFYHLCTAAGIKPVIGVEAYVAQDHTQKVKEYHHLTLLAISQTGYQNLLALVSTSYGQGFYYRPRIDWQLLEKYQEGLVCLTGCMSAELNKFIMAKNTGGVKQWLQRAKSIFGKRVYWEYTPAKYKDSFTAIPIGVELAKQYKLSPIVTSDVHYVNPEDVKLRNVVWQIRDNATLKEPNQTDEVEEYYLMGEDEIREKSLRFKLSQAVIDQAIESTSQIAEMSDVKIDHPKYLVANFCDEPLKLFRELCEIGRKKFRLESDVYRERLRYEMGVIEHMGLINYFLVVQDVIRFCEREKIMVGPGRGSAAGSLVCYVLGITRVDPIQYSLLFERFLNPGRVDSYPDIDTDIAHDDRDRVVQYLKQKYGADRVAQIITFGSMGPRTALKDTGRVLGEDFQMLNRLTQLIPTKIGGSPIHSLEQVLEHHAELKQESEAHPELFRVALELQKTPRHVSLHASALLITPEPMQQMAPLYRDPKSEALVCGLDMYDCEKLKLLKFDFLGLKTLSVIQQTLSMLKQPIDINQIDLQDTRVWDLFCSAQTVGTFQTETESMRTLLKKIQPRHLQELSVVNALDRPGPLNKKMDDLYVTHKRSSEALPVIDESIQHILAPTYQTLIYQEQVMQIAEAFAGFSKSDADVLRKSMGKKKRELVLQMKSQFLDGAQKLHRKPEVAEHLFTLIEEFSEYAFNMSHSLAYSLVSYQTAYLKVHAPLEFMCATLNVFSSQQEELEKYLRECRRMNIQVLPPDVNHSQPLFTLEGSAIRYALCAIRDIGTESAAQIVSQRPYRHVGEWLMKVSPNKKVIRAMVASGALDSLSPYRASVLQYCENHKTTKTKKAKQDTFLFNMEDIFTDQNVKILDQQLGTKKEHPIAELLQEKVYLGCYLRHHPLDLIPAIAQQMPHKVIRDVLKRAMALQNEQVTLHVLVESVKKLITKQSRLPMAYITVSDATGSLEAVLFPKKYEDLKTLIEPGSLLTLTGRVSKEQVLIDDLRILFQYPKAKA